MRFLDIIVVNLLTYYVTINHFLSSTGFRGICGGLGMPPEASSCLLMDFGSAKAGPKIKGRLSMFVEQQASFATKEPLESEADWLLFAS